MQLPMDQTKAEENNDITTDEWIELLQSVFGKWNKWRDENLGTTLSLREVDFMQHFTDKGDFYSVQSFSCAFNGWPYYTSSGLPQG